MKVYVINVLGQYERIVDIAVFATKEGANKYAMHWLETMGYKDGVYNGTQYSDPWDLISDLDQIDGIGACGELLDLTECEVQ